MNERGIALPVALIVLALLLALSIAFTSFAATERNGLVDTVNDFSLSGTDPINGAVPGTSSINFNCADVNGAGLAPQNWFLQNGSDSG